MENEFSKEMKDLKKYYIECKKKGTKERLEFLESVVSYCEHINFSEKQIMIFLAILRNAMPDVGQSWTDVDDYDDIDVQFNIEMKKKFSHKRPIS